MADHITSIMYSPATERRSSTSSILSSWSVASDDAHFSNDTTTTSAHDGSCIRRPSSAFSDLSCDGMTGDETRDLWRTMLELQGRYGCYNSTRIDLALSAGDEAVNLMPNPFIIDTLNESVHDLPDEGWEMLERHLRHDASSNISSRRKLWKRG